MASNYAPRRGNQGFTLIELIVAMVILAILAAIAIPSYNQYVLKSHRTEAKAALMDAASLEERYFSTANQYTNDPTKLGYGVPTPPIAVGTGYYVINTITPSLALPPTALVPGGTPAAFTITAVPAPGSMQVNDTACATFSIDSTGRQIALTSGGADNTANCWQN
jgi:type IV pilus assembly protein PilE